MLLKFERKMLIDASADKVWQINGESFADISKWSRNVEASRPLPGPPLGDADLAGRICTVKGFGEVHETLTEFDRTARAFSLLVTKGLPFFVRFSRFSSRIVPVSEHQCRYELVYEMDVSWFPGALLVPFLNRKLGQTVDEILADLKSASEPERGGAADNPTATLAQA